jgi:hypothetical protein
MTHPDLVEQLVGIVEANRIARAGTTPFRNPSKKIEATPYRPRDPKSFPSRAEKEDRDPHYKALRQFARDLGSIDEMERVYNEAAERFGYRSVLGVNSAWQGIHGWMC